jgi:hypothetical protein
MFRLFLTVELRLWMRREWRQHRPTHSRAVHRYRRRYARQVNARDLVNVLWAQRLRARPGQVAIWGSARTEVQP